MKRRMEFSDLSFEATGLLQYEEGLLHAHVTCDSSMGCSVH